MSLFLNQTNQRSQLQSKIATDMEGRASVLGKGNDPSAPSLGGGILEDSRRTTRRSLFWASVVAMLVIALVVFVLFIFER